MGNRHQNEKKFGLWEERPDGSRLYCLEIRGRLGWRALYLKEVDASENTLRFWQEIYDDQKRLVAVHQKLPLDQGHQRT